MSDVSSAASGPRRGRADESEATVAGADAPPAPDGATIDLEGRPRPAPDPHDATLVTPSLTDADGTRLAPTDQTVALPGEGMAREPADATLALPADTPGPDAGGVTGVWSEGAGAADGDQSFQLATVAAEWASAGRPADVAAAFPPVQGYEVMGELGRGAMGVVYKARQLGLKRLVALKMILSGGHASPTELTRFRVEAEAVARLQHPHIVQVYEIGDHAGLPFFSLEFVDGGCLADKLLSSPFQVRQAAALVQSLAQAMAYAHERGIVHRDLKPANVLLTRDGTPKITDFGLAKKLEDDSGATRAGAIMGTPSYMAPEQAEGRTGEIGPPADVYALGAILYDLLTGRPPFRGSTVLDTLHQVRTADPVPPARLHPRMPRDLETICLTCLQKEPAKRYANAQALADDLGRFLHGEPIHARPTPAWERAWKWARRRPAAAALVAVSALFVLALAGGGVAAAAYERRRADEADRLRRAADAQRARAEDEQRRAEARFRDAREAVEYMLSRVGQERLAYEPRMEQVRRDLLEKAAGFYERFLKGDGDNPAVRWEAARAAHKVGEVRAFLGQHAAAEKAYRRALALLEGLTEAEPGRADYRKELAAASYGLGNLLKDTGRREGARPAYLRAARMQQGLTAAAPAEAAPRRDLATSHHSLGVLEESLGRPGDAAVSYGQALALQKKLAADFPKETTYRQELARTWASLGRLEAASRPADAEKSLGEARALLGRLVADDAVTPGPREELLLACNQLGVLLRDARPGAAEPLFRRAVRLGEGLVRDFPTVPDYQQGLALSLNNLGVLLLAAGRRADADEAFRRSLSLKEKLAADFPLKPDYRRDLANGHNNHGVALHTHGRAADAAKAYARAEGLLRPLVKDFPQVSDYELELARTLINQGNLRLADRPAEAEGLYAEALERLGRVAGRDPKARDPQFERARADYLLGVVLQVRGKADAEKHHAAAAGALKALARTYPGFPEYRHVLASCLNNLADLYRATKRPEEAEATWKEAEGLLAKLAEEGPAQPAYPRERARALHNLGVLYNGLKRSGDAEKAHAKALGLRQALADKYPREPAYAYELATSHAERAVVFAHRGLNDDAVEQFTEALALLEALEKEHPDVAAYWLEQITQQANLAGLLKALGREDDRVKCYARLAALKEKRAKAFPEAHGYKSDLGRTLHELAALLLQRDEPAEARRRLADAARHQKAAVEQAPKEKAYRLLLAAHALALADALLALGDHAGAAKAVAGLVPSLPADWDQYHVAAALVARCVPLAAADAKLPEAKRKELAEAYGGQAVGLLKKARANGFKDADALRKAKEFEGVRGREDFKALLEEMGGKKAD